MRRKRYGKKLESPIQYAARRTCGAGCAARLPNHNVRTIHRPMKRCAYCGELMPRKRRREGRAVRLERPKQYEKRRTCNHHCGASLLMIRLRKGHLGEDVPSRGVKS